MRLTTSANYKWEFIWGKLSYTGASLTTLSESGLQNHVRGDTVSCINEVLPGANSSFPEWIRLTSNPKWAFSEAELLLSQGVQGQGSKSERWGGRGKEGGRGSKKSDWTSHCLVSMWLTTCLEIFLLGSYGKYWVLGEFDWREKQRIIYLQTPVPYCSKIPILGIVLPAVPCWACMGISMSPVEFHSSASIRSHQAMRGKVHNMGKMQGSVLSAREPTHSWPSQ